MVDVAQPPMCKSAADCGFADAIIIGGLNVETARGGTVLVAFRSLRRYYGLIRLLIRVHARRAALPSYLRYCFTAIGQLVMRSMEVSAWTCSFEHVTLGTHPLLTKLN